MIETISAIIKKFLTGSSKSSNMISSTGDNQMSKEVAKNYTEAQEARLAEFDVIDNDTAIELAAELGKDVRSIRAKAVRMGLYKAKDKVSKTGGKIESKEAIVADIAALIGKNLDGLEKAPKLVLQELRAKLSA